MLMCKVSGAAFVSGANALGWELMYRGDQSTRTLQLRFNDGNAAGGLQAQSAGIRIGDGQWHHIVAIADRSDRGYVYVDGVNVGEVTLSTRPGSWDSTGDFVIGARAGKDSSFLPGNAMECFAYDFGLNGLDPEAQARALVESIYYKGKFPTTGFVSKWLLNNTPDDSIGSNNLSLGGSAAYVTDVPIKSRSAAVARNPA